MDELTARIVRAGHVSVEVRVAVTYCERRLFVERVVYAHRDGQALEARVVERRAHAPRIEAPVTRQHEAVCRILVFAREVAAPRPRKLTDAAPLAVESWLLLRVENVTTGTGFSKSDERAMREPVKYTVSRSVPWSVADCA